MDSFQYVRKFGLSLLKSATALDGQKFFENNRPDSSLERLLGGVCNYFRVLETDDGIFLPKNTMHSGGCMEWVCP
jgi:hypothetical protein